MPQNHVLVIFGASGDLAKRKLIPALFSLERQGLLPPRFAVLGAGRTPLDDLSFRTAMDGVLRRDFPDSPGEARGTFLRKLHYVALDTSEPAAYAAIAERVAVLTTGLDIPRNVIFYLSTPPDLYPVIPEHLSSQGLNTQEDGWKRLVVEKPFGRDRESAQRLNRDILTRFGEDQIFRIDHYLGKETVQNMLVFRFANEIFDSLWNHRYVDYVEITAAETLGVESRAGYFDRAGIVRDMVQNHLLQVLAMAAIDPPVSFDAAWVRGETQKIFRSLRPFTAERLTRDAVFGQYTSSTVRGQTLAGYRDEPGVAPDSRTETFAALRIFVDNHRWFNVPFYLRVGKRLPTRVTEIVLHFKKTPHPAFGVRSGSEADQNLLVIRIQPDEGILLKVSLKRPGAGFAARTVNMDFHYKELEEARVPEAYERLLLDCMAGDATLYALGEAVEACWAFVDPLIAFRESGEAKVYGYPAGTWGPLDAEELVAQGAHTWRYPCRNLSNDGEYCEL